VNSFVNESRHLQVDYRADDGTVVISLAGEVDIASAPELEQAIDRAAASGARLVIVDLRGLEFMDSTGISLLVRAHQSALESEHRFAVTKGSPQVDRLLTLTGLDQHLTLLDRLEELAESSSEPTVWARRHRRRRPTRIRPPQTGCP
jgi:anti-sigma B factor antagonist